MKIFFLQVFSLQNVDNGCKKNVLTFIGFIQQETQNSKASQHPVELLQPLQLNLKLVVEFESQQPLDKTSDLSQMNPETFQLKVELDYKS